MGEETSEGVEAGDEIRRKEGGIGEEVTEADSLVMAAILDELMEELKGREKVALLEQEVHNAVA